MVEFKKGKGFKFQDAFKRDLLSSSKRIWFLLQCYIKKGDTVWERGPRRMVGKRLWRKRWRTDLQRSSRFDTTLTKNPWWSFQARKEPSNLRAPSQPPPWLDKEVFLFFTKSVFGEFDRWSQPLSSLREEVVKFTEKQRLQYPFPAWRRYSWV